MSGADLYALCSDAMMAAIKRKTVSMETGEKDRAVGCYLPSAHLDGHAHHAGADEEDSPLRLRAEDFAAALEAFQPSVSAEELLRYRRLQQELQGCNHGN